MTHAAQSRAPMEPCVLLALTLFFCSVMPLRATAQASSTPAQPSTTAQAPGGVDAGRPRPMRRVSVYYAGRRAGALYEPYGWIGVLGLSLSLATSPGAAFVTSIGYGHETTELHHDPTFEATSELFLVPVQAGLHIRTPHQGRFAFTGGIDLEMNWVRQRLLSNEGNWGFSPGVRFALGPEWSTHWNDLVLGGELSVEMTQEVENVHGTWNVDLSGVSGRLVLSRGF
jgi:hypothetical protein